MKKLAILVPVAVLSAVAACSDPPPPAPAPTPTPAPTPAPTTPPPATPDAAATPTATGPTGEAAVAEAETIFNTRCAACHGASGKGDGLAAQALNPKPRDYSDKAWQGTVTDELIAKVIVEGGPAIGKSPLMTANADLKDKPEVVKALVAKIRSFGK